MKSQHFFKTFLAGSAMLVNPFANAASMTNAEFYQMKDQITVQYKSAKSACASMKDNARDVCVNEAKSLDKVARAELQYKYSGKPADQTKVVIAKADGAYSVAKEKCDDRAGNDKDVCVKEAKAVHTKAVADAKANREIGEARKDSANEKRDADYSVAAEKCDSQAGEAKSRCIAAAKAKFGKS